jgi:hypothetical protein
MTISRLLSWHLDRLVEPPSERRAFFHLCLDVDHAQAGLKERFCMADVLFLFFTLTHGGGI